MSNEITLDQYRKLAGGKAPKPRAAPRLKLPPGDPPSERDASERARQPYCDRGWLFAQVGPTMRRIAYHRTNGGRAGPADSLTELLAMIDDVERSAP
jgi:hypothetical protein